MQHVAVVTAKSRQMATVDAGDGEPTPICVEKCGDNLWCSECPEGGYGAFMDIWGCSADDVYLVEYFLESRIYHWDGFGRRDPLNLTHMYGHARMIIEHRRE